MDFMTQAGQRLEPVDYRSNTIYSVKVIAQLLINGYLCEANYIDFPCWLRCIFVPQSFVRAPWLLKLDFGHLKRSVECISRVCWLSFCHLKKPHSLKSRLDDKRNYWCLIKKKHFRAFLQTLAEYTNGWRENIDAIIDSFFDFFGISL